MIGTTLAHFKITAKLGEGGMGEVYRAEDTKLGRDVAIKVLPEVFTEDPERFARFEREAQILASLNHPNIAAIHDLAEEQGTHFLVLELAEGEDLAARLARGPIPIEDALPLALQIAGALEVAHEKGIVHRDLKPANVMVGPDGQIKVLDFGLAKVWEPQSGDTDLTQSPTLTAQMTEAGRVLGTSAYMSPEQARGREVTKQTDIWAFGCLLFEMLTGSQAFPGDNLTDVLTAVVSREPGWETLPPELPPSCHRLLRRLLAKDQRDRLRDIGDARLDIVEAIDPPDEEPTEITAERARLPVVLLGAAVLLGAILGWVGSRFGGSSPIVQSSTRVDLSLPELAGGSNRWWGPPPFALSPDGRKLAFVATRGDGSEGLFLRDLDRFDSRLLVDDETPYGPFFSPDGEWIGFFTANGIRRVSLTGEDSRTIYQQPGRRFTPFGGTWLPDDRIVFGLEGLGLQAVEAAGGEPETLTGPDASADELHHGFPRAAAGGRHVLFSVMGGMGLIDSRPAVLSLDTGEWRYLLPPGREGRQVLAIPGGHLLYADGDRLVTARVDLQDVDFATAATSAVEGLHTDLGTGVAYFDASATGTLVYMPRIENSLVLVDRQGRWTSLLEERGEFLHPRLSPDGRRVSFLRQQGSDRDVWVADIDRQTTQPLTFDGQAPAPLWHPDGDRVTYGSNNILQMRADGTGEPETLFEDERDNWPMSWAPDGSVLAFERRTADRSLDIWVLQVDETITAEPLISTSFNEESPRISPDGKWLAYISDHSGRYEVYVTSFPSLTGRSQISVNGGSEPVWSTDMSEIFYRREDRTFSVEVRLGGQLEFGRPVLLFEGPFNRGDTHAHFDVSHDGEHFVMVRENRDAFRTLRLILNFQAELPD